MQTLAVILIGVVFFLALYGWGRLSERLMGVRHLWPLTICLGMAVWIFLGGLLNLGHLAFSGPLDAIVLSGIGLAV